MDKIDLIKLAKWIGENGIRYDGIHVWKKPCFSIHDIFYESNKYVYYNTEQLIQQFLKEVK